MHWIWIKERIICIAEEYSFNGWRKDIHYFKLKKDLLFQDKNFSLMGLDDQKHNSKCILLIISVFNLNLIIHENYQCIFFDQHLWPFPTEATFHRLFLLKNQMSPYQLAPIKMKNFYSLNSIIYNCKEHSSHHLLPY